FQRSPSLESRACSTLAGIVISTSDGSGGGAAGTLMGQAMKGAQGLGDAPGLCETTARCVGRIAVHDLADASYAALIQMVGDPPEKRDCMSGIAVYTVVREGKGTQEPAPDGSLVVGSIALTRVSQVATCIVRVAGCKAAQADGSQQLCGTHVYDRAPVRGPQQPRPERAGKTPTVPQARTPP